MDTSSLENVLTLTKSLITLYENGTVEASNKKTRDVMEQGLKDTFNMQDTLYQSMKEDEMYTVENVSESVISKCLKKLKEAN